MRISINLATQPFEDRRSFALRWAAITAAVLALTIALIVLSVIQYRNRQQYDRELSQINNQRTQVQKERQQVEVFLNQPQNRGTRDHAQFLNALILRKTFSWTAVFSELEHILPATVQVTAIRPEVDENNHLSVRLAVESESRDGALEFIKRIESTQHFRDPRLLAEHHGAPGEGGDVGGNLSRGNGQSSNAVTYEISAEYIPTMVVNAGQNGGAK